MPCRLRRFGRSQFGSIFSTTEHENAEQGARANVRDCHASCRATSRANPSRGSSVTLANKMLRRLLSLVLPVALVGAAAPPKMKTIAYRGGVITFRVPATWKEE